MCNFRCTDNHMLMDINTYSSSFYHADLCNVPVSRTSWHKAKRIIHNMLDSDRRCRNPCICRFPERAFCNPGAPGRIHTWIYRTCTDCRYCFRKAGKEISCTHYLNDCRTCCMLSFRHCMVRILLRTVDRSYRIYSSALNMRHPVCYPGPCKTCRCSRTGQEA